MPEYVTLDANGAQIMQFCISCNAHLQKKQLPKFCLRNGYDFGSAARAGLPKLSDLAICLLNPVALYGYVVKLVAPQGYNSNAQHSALIGHIIAFENKITTNDECKELPRLKVPPSLFSITLIGAKKDALEKHRLLRHHNPIFGISIPDILSWCQYLTTLQLVDPNRFPQGTVFTQNLDFITHKLEEILDDVLEYNVHIAEGKFL